MSQSRLPKPCSLVAVTTVLLFGVVAAVAQTPPPAPADAAKTPAPVPEEKTPLPGLVIEVEGSVDWAVAGVSASANEGWTAVKLNDELKPGTQIRTGLRSHVNLRFGETTVVSLRSATYASLDQLFRSADVESVRIGLGYGTVRGGSSEGTFRSDVIVDSPVATLAKRGTEGWQLAVEAASGRFNVSLAESGLVEAIQKLGGEKTRSKTVRPGEYVTDATMANLWLDQDIFDRNVTFFAAEGMTSADAKFTLTGTRGMGVMAAGGGSELWNYSDRVSASWITSQLGSRFPAGGPLVNTAIGQRGPVTRPEGNFGTDVTFRAVVPAGLSDPSGMRLGTVRMRSQGVPGAKRPGSR